ncbi:mitochondrial uncoupling protein 4 isoform X2 [Octopus bimaculoides]|uniref:mitochondrial uncoupling protein 4 isoform X2 n=1 Tax=Octopus bimaculoides TaxID=37653 RepID=UPI00071D67CC|nr:mitochondrial uncoupling protein 4 isoform X2 [Octopus bimaculoides]|eukprot:XP_014774018.1 PREDICTED: mitochondrial uncoupling protein 4-like isoform X3 [Octopus bimaculoides]
MLVKDGKKHNKFAFKYLLSSASAVVAETVTYPLDLTKTRLQIQGELASKSSNGKANPYRGMIKTAVGIAKEEGFHKLWQGVTPALVRHIVYTGCRMTFYEILRDNVFHKNPDGVLPVWKAACCGLTAGMLGQFVASPTDLIKVQMQMEGKNRLLGNPVRVKSMYDAFCKITAEGGVRGLWKGWIPNVQRAGLVNMGDLATYDTSKHFILRNTSLKDNAVTHFLSRGILYTSSWDCVTKTVKAEGFWSLYKGFFPIWARMAPWSLTFWLSLEQMRKHTGASSF